MRLALAIIALAIATGCTQQVSMQISFPVREDFDRSETLQLAVVPLREGVTCSSLRAQAALGRIEGAEVAVPSSAVCSFNGHLDVTGVNQGDRAYVVWGIEPDRGGGASRVMTTGCAIRDVWSDGSALRIVMGPTPASTAETANFAERPPCP